MRHIHFIGIGGIGMSGIAQILIKKGYKVSGSDLKKSNLTENLENLGAKIYYNHNKSNIDGADTVVYSTAISENNIEVQSAKEAGIQIIKRAEMLGFLMNGQALVRCGFAGDWQSSRCILLGLSRTPAPTAAGGCGAEGPSGSYD